MFPLLGLRLSGLQPDVVYDVAVDLVPVDRFRHRYIYHRSQWMINGTGTVDELPKTLVCRHPSSLTRLQQATVTFDKLKLTNDPDNCNDHVILCFVVRSSLWILLRKLLRFHFNFISSAVDVWIIALRSQNPWHGRDFNKSASYRKRIARLRLNWETG